MIARRTLADTIGSGHKPEPFRFRRVLHRLSHMHPGFRSIESHGRGAAHLRKYGLIVAALSAATLTVAIAIAAKLAVVPPGAIGG